MLPDRQADSAAASRSTFGLQRMLSREVCVTRRDNKTDSTQNGLYTKRTLPKTAAEVNATVDVTFCRSQRDAAAIIEHAPGVASLQAQAL